MSSADLPEAGESVDLILRCAGRTPDAAEQRLLAQRAAEISPEDLVDTVDLPAEAFLAWLRSSR